MTDRLKQFLERAQQFVDQGLESYLPPESTYPEDIHKSMRYSVFAGGKRIRPALAFAAWEACGGNADKEPVRLACCALEMLHAFSLIHDDLPCMDNDDFRRGKPTNHRVFGEAIAVLGGDALCIHAFTLLARTRNPQVISEIGEALGTAGMLGGQVVDIQSEGKQVAMDTLEYIHTHKTGALITSSVRVGAILADADHQQLQALTDYGKSIGLAFQIADDILDVVGTTKQIGKDAGSDQARGKVTYPSLKGLDESKAEAHALVDRAQKAISIFGDRAAVLADTAAYIVSRVN